MRAGCSHCRPKPHACPCCGRLANEKAPGNAFYLWCLTCARGECDGKLCPDAEARIKRAAEPYRADCFSCGSTREDVALDVAHMNDIHRAAGVPEVVDPFCCEA